MTAAAPFDESRWNLLKIRWISIVGAVANVVYGLLYFSMASNYYDPPWQRLVVSAVLLVIGFATWRNDLKQKYIQAGFAFGVYLLTAHIFYLVVMNDVAPIYVMGSFILFFSAGAAFTDLRPLIYYFVGCITVGATLYFWRPGESTAILLMATVVSGAISFAVFATLIHLLRQLRQSRAAIEVKNQALDGMLNSLGQGFFSFDSSGLCLPIFSRACVDLLEVEPGLKSMNEVLKIPADKQKTTTELAKAFSSREALAELIKSLPRVFPHSEGRHITLDYHVSARQGHTRGEVVVVATDRSDLVRLERAAEVEKRHSMMIATIVKQKRFFRVFLDDLNRGLQRFGSPQMAGRASDRATIFDVPDFKRFLHSIKGGAGMFWMDEISQLLHACENEWLNGDFAPAVLARHQCELLRAAFEKIVTANADVLGNEFRSQRLAEFSLTQIQSILRGVDFDKVPAPIQNEITQLALQPIVKYFEPFSDLAVRLARAQRKKLLPIEFIGGDLAIFPEPYSELFSSFVHVFRNAVDHGLETPAERVERGKPETGRITVTFSTKGSGRKFIVIEVKDDGRGIDPARIRENLPALGARDVADAELIQAVFGAGFSTAKTTTELSGRGVGLDALSFAVQSLGGSVRVESRIGHGALFTIEIPEVNAREILQGRTLGIA